MGIDRKFYIDKMLKEHFEELRNMTDAELVALYNTIENAKKLEKGAEGIKVEQPVEPEKKKKK